MSFKLPSFYRTLLHQTHRISILRYLIVCRFPRHSRRYDQWKHGTKRPEVGTALGTWQHRQLRRRPDSSDAVWGERWGNKRISANVISTSERSVSSCYCTLIQKVKCLTVVILLYWSNSKFVMQMMEFISYTHSRTYFTYLNGWVTAREDRDLWTWVRSSVWT